MAFSVHTVSGVLRLVGADDREQIVVLQEFATGCIAVSQMRITMSIMILIYNDCNSEKLAALQELGIDKMNKNINVSYNFIDRVSANCSETESSGCYCLLKE